MLLDLYTALAIGTACVLICTSDVMQWFRDWIGSLGEWPDKLVNCTFCTSVWLAILAVANIYPGADAHYDIRVWPALRAGAIIAVANIAVLLIHASIATIGVDDEPVQDS